MDRGRITRPESNIKLNTESIIGIQLGLQLISRNITNLYDLLCLVTVTVEEDQKDTLTCSPGAFIQQINWGSFLIGSYTNNSQFSNFFSYSKAGLSYSP